MATNFPNSLDVLPNPTPTTLLNQPGLRHDEQHANANDAIVAIENKLGIDLSSTTYTIDYIIRLFLLTNTQHPDGYYAEYERVPGKVFPAKIVWYTNPTKTIKLVEKTYTYATLKPVPTTITMRLYDGTIANTVVRTIIDNISYNQVFETSRTRTVT